MPTSSQNTNTIARLPAMQMPSIENENSDKYWKKRWNRPRRCRCSPLCSVTSWSTYIVQLIVHVADGINMNARGDERHHAEHHDGQRIDVIADGELQVAELSKRVPVAGFVVRRAVRGMLLGLLLCALPASAAKRNSEEWAATASGCSSAWCSAQPAGTPAAKRRKESKY